MQELPSGRVGAVCAGHSWISVQQPVWVRRFSDGVAAAHKAPKRSQDLGIRPGTPVAHRVRPVPPDEPSGQRPGEE